MTTKYAKPLTSAMVRAGQKASRGLIGYTLLPSAVAAIWAAMGRARKDPK